MFTNLIPKRLLFLRISLISEYFSHYNLPFHSLFLFLWCVWEEIRNQANSHQFGCSCAAQPAHRPMKLRTLGFCGGGSETEPGQEGVWSGTSATNWAAPSCTATHTLRGLRRLLGGGRQGLRDRRAPRGGCGALTEPLTVLKLREIPIKKTGIGAPRPSGRKGAVQAPEALPGRPPLPWRSGAGPPPPPCDLGVN